jgi:2-phospho-L-lactate/phosphoenolpyruvate guanylyltransferase
MRVWAIIPVKPFVRAKSRLADVLDAKAREALAENMFRHSLGVVKQSALLAGCTVVSRDTRVLAIAREYKAFTVKEEGAPELNAALARASEVARLQSADAVLVLPADLPLHTAQDIDEMITLGRRYHVTVVIAPDRKDEGTNAMLMTPPNLIPFSYGPNSFQRHVELAKATKATVQIHRSARLALDLDTPEDLDYYKQLVANTAANPHGPLLPTPGAK